MKVSMYQNEGKMLLLVILLAMCFVTFMSHKLGYNDALTDVHYKCREYNAFIGDNFAMICSLVEKPKGTSL